MLKIPENKPPALRIDTHSGHVHLKKTHVPPEELAHFDHYNYRPIFISIEEAVEMWKPLKNYTANAPKSIKHLVLVEADESLHSRLTWTTVTHCMDNDTGIPRVKWSNSKTESMYLEALHCKREKSEIAVIPSMLRITTDEPTEEKKYFSASTANPPVHQVPSPVQSPASVKPSSAGFGFSFSNAFAPIVNDIITKITGFPTTIISSATSFKPELLVKQFIAIYTLHPSGLPYSAILLISHSSGSYEALKKYSRATRQNVQHRHTMPTELLSLWNSPSLSVSPKQTYPTSPTSSIILSPVHMDNTSNRGSLVGSPTQINSIKSMDQFLSDKPVQTETTKPPRPILPLEDFWSNKPLQPSKSPAETRSTMPIQSLIPVDDFWAIESTQPIRTTQEINKNQPSLMDDFWSNDFIQPTKQTQPTEHSYPVPSMQPFQTTHNAIIHKKETSLNNTAYNVMTHKAVQNPSETKIDFEFGDFLAAPLETNASDDFGDFASSSQHDDWPSTWEVADTSTTASKQPVKEEDEWGEWATFK
ncbi:hypothetical protein J3Q64DRAFT_1717718 [Phycomyces blakesleeanus]|uniref:Uncharacterized protein n=1 Tax=Phycomyces blakesleeanus TaxID=4837 RepID=A0ABR3B863_PHYBL